MIVSTVYILSITNVHYNSGGTNPQQHTFHLNCYDQIWHSFLESHGPLPDIWNLVEMCELLGSLSNGIRKNSRSRFPFSLFASALENDFISNGQDFQYS